MPVYEFQGKQPDLSDEAFIHPEAVIIGDVAVGAGSFIGPGAVIRGDFGPVILGENVSLQDNAVVHVSPGSQVTIEDNCIVGHGALLHDVRLETGSVVGMGAILLFNVCCEAGSFVAAGSLVARGMTIPAGAVAAGSPAKVIRSSASSKQIRQAREGALLYRELAFRYRATMKRIP